MRRKSGWKRDAKSFAPSGCHPWHSYRPITEDFLGNGVLDFHEDPTHFHFLDLSVDQLTRLLQFMEREFGQQEPVPSLLSFLRVRSESGWE